MQSDPTHDDIAQLREEVRDLARQNAELRTMLEQQLPAGGRAPAHARAAEVEARLPTTERERRLRVLRRLTFTLVLLALGIVALILAAGPPKDDGEPQGTPTAAPTSEVQPVPAPPAPPPVPEPRPTPGGTSRP